MKKVLLVLVMLCFGSCQTEEIQEDIHKLKGCELQEQCNNGQSAGDIESVEYGTCTETFYFVYRERGLTLRKEISESEAKDICKGWN